MGKPTLQMALHQVTPSLPDPCEFTARISASLRFIDENPTATTSDLTPEMLDLWRINLQELEIVRVCFEHVAEMIEVAVATDAGEATQASVVTEVARETETRRVDFGPRLLSSMIIFAHIYLTYYRTEDFADLENFADCYVKFQQLLHCARSLACRPFRLFDIENLDRTLDEISPNRRHF